MQGKSKVRTGRGALDGRIERASEVEMFSGCLKRYGIDVMSAIEGRSFGALILLY